MKITIDEEVCNKYNLKLSDVIALLLIKTTENAYDTLSDLEKVEAFVSVKDQNEQTHLLLTNRWDDLLSSIRLESDKSIPPVEALTDLAKKMRELFPKGIKVGSSVWRGNVREIVLRLQSFYELYGNNYTPEDILNATKRYVESFNGDYTKMRILKYFILKHERNLNEDGIKKVEDISDLANFLENDCIVENPDDWAVELR